MATTMGGGGVDLDALGKYPIVLSDSLLRKPSRDLFTGLRYNHKPSPTSRFSTTDMHLQPSPISQSTFDLSFTENEEQYDYTGTRSSGAGQYVLIFDAEKKHFVLHRLDSTFDMNLTSAPWTDDSAILKDKYPQIGALPKQAIPQRRGSKVKASAAKKRGSLSGTKKTKALPKESSPEPQGEESDDGLEIEYPGGPPAAQKSNIFSTPNVQRETSKEVSDEDSEGGSATSQAKDSVRQRDRNRDVDMLQLPSPVNGINEANGGLSEDDIEADLEAELEQALQAEIGSVESDESEEE